MYLSKNASGTYYTRLPLPKSLRDRGLPFAIRTSLCTKDRQLAVDRNLAVAARTRALIAATPADTTPRSFYRWIRADLDAFKAAGFAASLTPSQSIASPIESSTCPAKGIALTQALTQFLDAKSSEGIQHKSVGQLQLRINAFVTWAKGVKADQVTPTLAQEYRNILLRKSDISFKTKTDYLAALKQFFRWCVALDYCSRNPFDGLTAGKRPNKRADEERVRWHRPQLAQLFASLRSKQSQKGRKLKIQDWWVPLLCLYAGLRPSEACQLKTLNVKQVEGIWCLMVDAGEVDQQLKSANAYRTVPLHSALIGHQFLDYVESRRGQGQVFLFDDKPSGKDDDWAHNITCRFQRHLNDAGIVGQGRPTLYGLRHSFIDELQQADVAEHIVAELAGHSKTGITFGRYGKRVSVSLLKEKIELIPRDLV
ncbi:site-specific integrase [Aeromonas caviae]|uniref:site-specific integrase n=1 Tax=Aeromonas TaxID=642 RepID=UPI001E30AB44|nr:MULTISPECIES: site-specific integrase [Aeromonas]MCR3929686.1 site-specific integrase [Aeromonas caviae]MCR3967084.1 site-specific integrase [Aeromonas veronii]MCR3979560.1 site-specific integrase [Aeromonas veronii]WMX35935.1 site-specific integrase [Aeromonas caviae]